jgi:hypothetical protein
MGVGLALFGFVWVCFGFAWVRFGVLPKGLDFRKSLPNKGF